MAYIPGAFETKGAPENNPFSGQIENTRLDLYWKDTSFDADIPQGHFPLIFDIEVKVISLSSETVLYFAGDVIDKVFGDDPFFEIGLKTLMISWIFLDHHARRPVRLQAGKAEN